MELIISFLNWKTKIYELSNDIDITLIKLKVIRFNSLTKLRKVIAYYDMITFLRKFSIIRIVIKMNSPNWILITVKDNIWL